MGPVKILSRGNGKEVYSVAYPGGSIDHLRGHLRERLEMRH